MKRVLFAFSAAISAVLTIGILSYLNYGSNLNILLLIPSFGSSVVLLFGVPESPFSKPKNIFFGHLITSLVGIIALHYVKLPIFLVIPIAVGCGIFFMILLNVTHPPAGGNPVIVIVSNASYDFLVFPIIIGTVILIFFAIIINRYVFKRKYSIY